MGAREWIQIRVASVRTDPAARSQLRPEVLCVGVRGCCICDRPESRYIIFTSEQMHVYKKIAQSFHLSSRETMAPQVSRMAHKVS